MIPTAPGFTATEILLCSKQLELKLSPRAGRGQGRGSWQGRRVVYGFFTVYSSWFLYGLLFLIRFTVSLPFLLSFLSFRFILSQDSWRQEWRALHKSLTWAARASVQGSARTDLPTATVEAMLACRGLSSPSIAAVEAQTQSLASAGSGGGVIAAFSSLCLP